MIDTRTLFFNWVLPAVLAGVATVSVWWIVPDNALVVAAVAVASTLASVKILGRSDSPVDEECYLSPSECQPALSVAGVGLWIWDFDKEHLHCTRDVFDILGWDVSKPKLTVEEFRKAVHVDDQRAFSQAVEGVRGGTRRSSFDCRFVRPRGGVVWVEISMSLLESTTLGVRIAGVMTDVTERKHVEAQLDRGSAYLEALLENTDNMVFSMDRDFRLTVFNSRFISNVRAAYGKRLHLGDNLLEVSPPAVAEVWKPRYVRALAGESFRVEEVFVIGNSRYYFDVSLKPIREHEIVVGAAVYSRNITKQKEREKEWIRAKDRAEESDRLKSAFLANMSHEIRTPLNAVMGFAQLLKSDEAKEEEKQRFVDIILSNGEHLLRILGDIIDLAKIESDQIQVDPVAFDLGMMMAEVYSVFRDRIRKGSDDLVELKFDNQIHERDVVVCDETRLKQVIYNLVSNAAKFTFQGSIRVGYRRTEEKLVEFFVADTGGGIPEEMRDSVFKRFRQGAANIGRRNDGVGLGLSICKGLVELLGGSIWVEENVPHGTIFKFTIRDFSDELELTQDRLRAAEGQEGIRRDGRVSFLSKVLVAEDDEMNFQVLDCFLKQQQIEAVRALNGQEAVELVRRDSSIGLVFMDLSMPVLDGLAATRQIKTMRPELPVIAHTAHAMKHELERAREAGCSDCLVKPIDMLSFKTVLSRYVGGQE